MSAIFDAYVIVDWSAANTPVRGANSIWICALERRDGSLIQLQLANPATRAAAAAELADLFSDLVARDRITLAGFDIAFGYPTGFAQKLRGENADWRAVWKELMARIRDSDNNANNRFDVAADLNQKLSSRDLPFWGCANGTVRPHLSAHKPHGMGEHGWPEYRMTDRVIGAPKSVWQLAYAGSVGGQTLVGIPYLHKLRHHSWFADVARVWPFETGLRPITRPGTQDWKILFAETYPSLIEAQAEPDEVKDCAQVRTYAHALAAMDGEGRLGGLFAGPSEMSPEERHVIETEEAWILGIETARPMKPSGAPSRYEYLRDGAAIYEKSFALIRAEADVSDVPRTIRPLIERVIHACGDPEIVKNFKFTDDIADSARTALETGAPILVDATMVAHGIIRARLAAANPVICTLSDPGVARAAQSVRQTRSATAVERWIPHLDGAVVAIGNAPTALFRLLELLDDGAPRPAAILAFPVGFVGAAESKDALIAHTAGIPYLTLRGRRGGSAMAAAAVNALGVSP